MKKIALFDFDGTITTKDTMLEFIKFYKGKTSFYTGFLLLSPVMVAMKLKLLSNEKAKECMLTHFFKNESAEVFDQKAKEFGEKIIPSLIRKKALSEINTLKQEGTPIYIVSASASNWIVGWSQPKDIKLIATQLEIKEGKITGKLAGKNCNGPEKAERIKKAIDLSEYEIIHAYGDTSGDTEMLALATHPGYRHFHE